MLTIEYQDGSVYNVRTQHHMSEARCKDIKEIYVDGDEMLLLLGLPESTHGSRGITMTGKGLETLVDQLQRKYLKKENDLRAAQAAVNHEDPPARIVRGGYDGPIKPGH